LSRYFPAAEKSGFQNIIPPETDRLKLLAFSLLSLSSGESWQGNFPGREAALVILGGKGELRLQGQYWPEVGARENVFAGRAYAAYVPPGEEIAVKALTPLEIAFFTAPAGGGGEAFLVRPEEVVAREVGRENWRRSVQNIFDDRHPAVKRLLVGETYNVPGGWSSYPPHKHDEFLPEREVSLEEIYHFRLNPPQGFGFQRIYSPSAGLDEAFVIKQGDTVIIPCGYHPVAAAPGYALYYLWGLAGEKREMRPREDDAHSWVNQSS
jgi:5-deoxy-glucuronate isomerase